MPDYFAYPGDNHNWEYVYGNIKGKIPYIMPNPKGREVKINMFADANLYHNKLTGRSVTGLLMIFKSMPNDWFSKKQGCVGTATYGSQFAARDVVDMVVEMRYMLRMLGVPVK